VCAACHDPHVLRTVHRACTQAQGAAVEQDAAEPFADGDVVRGDQSAGHVQRAGGGRGDAEVDLVGHGQRAAVDRDERRAAAAEACLMADLDVFRKGDRAVVQC